MPSLASLRNPFRKAPQVAPTLRVTGSTDSFTSTSTTTTAGHSAYLTGSSENITGSSLGRPYSSLSISTDKSTGLDSSKSTDSKAIPIIRGKEGEYTGEYKLSVVNDSGVYLPPSPTEKKSFWGKRNGGKSDSPIDRTSMDEPFTIPRESCEGYRRSFDISARSPVIDASRPSLQLDGRSPRPSFERLTKLSPPTKIEEISTNDDGFEEIKLDDGKPKKRGIFARFGGDSTTTTPSSKFIMPFKKDIPAETVHESELKRMSPTEKQGIQLTA